MQEEWALRTGGKLADALAEGRVLILAAITALEHAPMTGVMDETYKVAITRMGNRLRIAGTAEIGTRGMKLRDNALSTLIKVAGDWFPAAAAYRKAQFWVGARFEQ